MTGDEPEKLTHGTQPTLRTPEGLVLRPWSPDDAADVLAAYQDPTIRRWHHHPEPTLTATAALLENWARAWDAGSGAHWAVTSDGALLARVSLKHFSARERSAEIAYWALPFARGRGIVSTAVGTATEWGFRAIGLHRIELEHSIGNPASCRVAGKCGFAWEGTKRQSIRHADGWHDMHLHARLSDD
ncbi:GNAT family N-acetyltransferase [Nocardia panacis]|uniref:GNAT family N-acetyltransferase n=1 Tax=Nocardia panacis TaxID=2340916 RepID=UPI0013159872|nr:GNAT family N-acetyltransferase [Nocardia panacis]